MRFQKYLTAILTLSCAGCAHMQTVEITTLDVATVSVKRNALIMHMNGGEVYAVDLAEVKIETPGALLNTTLPIAIPSMGTKSYDVLIAAVPARKKMSDMLRSPARKLIIQVRTDDLNRYLEIKDDKSRTLPSLDVLTLKSVEPRGQTETARPK